MEEIQVLLEKGQKDNINAIFNRLKELPFIDKVITISDLKKIEESKFTIEKHFAKIDSLILETKKFSLSIFMINNKQLYT